MIDGRLHVFVLLCMLVSSVSAMSNSPPIALDDCFVEYWGTVDFCLHDWDILSNDYDPDGDSLAIEIVNGPSHGSLFMLNDQNIIYAPELFIGTDTFIYRVFDGTEYSEPATVYITLLPAFNAPWPEDDYYTIFQDTTLVVEAPGIIENDWSWSQSLDVDLVEQPTHGIAILEHDGSFIYIPNPGFCGTDTFQYMLTDLYYEFAFDFGNVFINVEPESPPIPVPEFPVIEIPLFISSGLIGTIIFLKKNTHDFFNSDQLN